MKREGEEKYLITSGANTSSQLVHGLNSESEKLFFRNKIACEWLSTEEAAHFLSVSDNALRIMVYRNQIPVFKFGRRLRFRVKDCQALFKTKGA
ncbi:MAG: helix-turn-helix domain-containing protein [Bdellovibrionales bacterium]